MRHGYLKQQIQRVTEDPTFLNDEENAVVEFAALVHARSAADLRVWFVEKLIDALDSVYVDPSLGLLQRRGEWFLRAFLRADPSIFAAWGATNDLPDHQPMLSQLLADPTIFSSLTPHAKDIVVNALAQHAAERLLAACIALEPFANEEGELRLTLKQLGAAVKSLSGVTQDEREHR